MEVSIAIATSQIPVEIDEPTTTRPVSGSVGTAGEAARCGPVNVSISYMFGNIACDSVEDSKMSLPPKDGAFETSAAMHIEKQGNFASPFDGSRQGRKRKYLNNLNSTGAVLRRSARRGSTKTCDASEVLWYAVNDLASSPAVKCNNGRQTGRAP